MAVERSWSFRTSLSGRRSQTSKIMSWGREEKDAVKRRLVGDDMAAMVITRLL